MALPFRRAARAFWGSRGIDGHGSNYPALYGARLRGATAGIWQGVQESLEAVGDVDGR